MAETKFDIKSFYQETCSVDNEQHIRELCLTLKQLPSKAFFKFVNKHVKLTFSNRYYGLSIDKQVLFATDCCDDPYMQLGLMCFRPFFRKLGHFECSVRENFMIAINEIVVVNYIPYVEGHLFNAYILLHLIHKVHENGEFSRIQSRFCTTDEIEDLTDELYAKLIDLFANLILIVIKCMNFEHVRNVLLVSNEIVHFFDIFFEKLEYIADFRTDYKRRPLIEKSEMSSISVITNCILLFQSKLLASSIYSAHWSNVICRMEKLRDHITFFSLPTSSGTSLQRFLTERAYGSFNTNLTKQLYNVTNNIREISISERSTDITVTDITVRDSLAAFRQDISLLVQHLNHICYSCNIKDIVLKDLYAVDVRYIPNAIVDINVDDFTDEDLYSSPRGSELDSNSETEGETDYLDSNEERSTNGSEDSNSETDGETDDLDSNEEQSTNGSEDSNSETEGETDDLDSNEELFTNGNEDLNSETKGETDDLYSDNECSTNRSEVLACPSPREIHMSELPSSRMPRFAMASTVRQNSYNYVYSETDRNSEHIV
ncbi:unnamed protein product [Meganyctiphanes norvegica]|uniref:Uncharacterized protein n=1 Tax=Meganyctiphanes norvegica TaxID=48144 RepID=A0AAV2PT67_MEGNR